MSTRSDQILAALSGDDDLPSILAEICGSLAEQLAPAHCSFQQRTDRHPAENAVDNEILAPQYQPEKWIVPVTARNGERVGHIRIESPPDAAPSAQHQEVLDAHRRFVQLAFDRHAGTPLAGRRERLQQFVLDQSPDGIYLLDDAQRILAVNRTACEMLGYSETELTNMHVADIDVRIRTGDQAWLDWIRSHRFLTFASEHETKDGTRFPVEIAKSFVELDGIQHICAFVRDLRDRRAAEADRLRQVLRREQAELLLEERQSLLNSIIDSVTDPLFVKDLQGRYILVNSADMEVLQRDGKDIVGKFDKDLFPDTYQTAIETDQQVLQSGAPIEMEYRLPTPQGLRWFKIRKYPWRDTRGRIGGVIGIARDHTAEHQNERERTLLAERARQAQKMQSLGQLAGGLAHDFNNLLTAILGNTELLIQPVQPAAPTPAPTELHALQQIREAGRRAASLTHQLLAFSRQRVGTPVAIDLRETIRSTTTLLRHLLSADIRLHIDTPAQPACIVADPNQVEQIIVNLMMNAADAMPGGGTLAINLTTQPLPDSSSPHAFDLPPGQYLVMDVSDTGRGMTAEVRERAFEPFFTTKPREQGTGMGLATVYGAVKQLGGDVTIESTPGDGTHVYVVMPASTAELPKVDGPPLSSGAETILVCEDDRLVREVTCLTLQSAGYNVHAAEHGPHALKLVAAAPKPIDLLISDVIMPEMNGRELATQLAGEYPAMRVLFVSGYTADVLDAQGIAAAGNRFLQKPYGPTVLLERVRQILDAPSTA